MKVKEHKSRKTSSARAAVKSAPSRWWVLGPVGAGLLLLFLVYGPALHGPLLFDDSYLPGFEQPLRVWVSGGRPLLMLTYFWNATQGGGDPFGFHVFNVLIHAVAGGLVFLILRKLLEWSGARLEFAALGAALFLFHPVQTEAVAYISGRSEEFSVMFALAAFTVFLYRRPATWSTIAAILLLFALALLSKEQVIVLPAVFLLTDWWWNPRGMRENWRLYLAMAVCAAGGVALFWNLIMHAGSAGFALKEFTWYQYLFTEWRALWVYLGLFLFPVRLTADWDFPISKSVFDHGAIVGLAALLGLAAAAWHYRRRFPLASYGFFVFLLLMAPTSSILPIRDPIAERRLYAATLGLLLIVADCLSRLHIDRKTLIGAGTLVVAIAAIASYSRARLWGDPVALWQDTVDKSPNKSRPHFQLASARYEQGRSDLAIPEFQKAADLEPPTPGLLIDWALAYDALGQPEQALAKLRQSAALEASAHVYTQMAMVYAKRSEWEPALDALATAEKLDAGFAPIYNYRGGILLKTGKCAAAARSYRRALEIDPYLDEAKRNFGVAEACAARAR